MPFLKSLTARAFVTVSLGAASILGLACSPTETEADTENENVIDSVEAAENAYFRFNLEEASAIYGRIWTDEAALPKDRAKAGRQLARFAALFDQDLDRARELLTKEEVPTLLMLAKIERESGNYQAARNATKRATATAETSPERHDATTEFAWAALREAVEAILEGQASHLDSELLSEAFARIDTVLKDRRGLLIPSLVQLKLALILGNGPKVLEAWNSYFHIRPGTAPTGVLAEPARALERLLPHWHGQDLDDATRADLVLALAGSRMFEAAALLASLDREGTTGSDPRIQEILAYHGYLSTIGERTVAFYRASSAGHGNQSAYKEDLERAARALWPRLHWPDEPPRFSSTRFEAEIDKRFGAETTFKGTGGHLGLHMGHRVVDEVYPVEQYGKEAALRFISLDFMVSNGYSSWFWDGRANVGGWADNPTIIQVRRAYAGAGLRAWEEMTDPKKRREAEEEIAEYEPGDIQLARGNPTTYLPGLARRIGFVAQDRLLNELEASGLESSELRLAFIAEIERIDLESSIVAHEGRHAIESRHLLNFMRRGAEKEFLAKLSEVAFSSAPFLAIGGGILSRNIGDGTSHGEANLRIMKGVVEWMKENRAAIDSLDPDIPLLPQLDLLTDEQLRQAFRSLDPMVS